MAFLRLIISIKQKGDLMGGMGSSRWDHIRTRRTIEETQALDIRFLRRCGNMTGWLTWKRNGKPDGNALYCVGTDSLTLEYGAVSGQKTKHTIQIETTPCTYGGVRQWLVCPDCGRRVCILYRAAGHFQCRHCCNLAHLSQQECPHDRLMRKARKIRASIGGGENLFEAFPGKPKRMRWKTYGKLQAISEGANMGSMKITAQRLGICGFNKS
jgi:hypothetical protein